MKLNNNKKKTINTLKFLLTIMVVLIHNTHSGYSSLKNGGIVSELLLAIEKYSRFIGFNVVPCFFIISGILMFYNIDKKNINAKLYNRIFSLLIPYIAWGMMYAVGYVLLNVHNISFINLLKIVLLATNPFDLTQLTQFWYIKVLMIYVLFTPAIYLLTKSKIAAYLLVIFSYFIYGFLFESNNIYLLNLIFYAFGAVVGTYTLALINLDYKKHTVIISFIMFVLFTYLRVNYEFFNSPFIAPIIIVLNCIFIYVIIDNFKNIRISSDLLNSQFFIYGSHLVIINIIKKLFFYIGEDNVIWATISYFSSPLLTIILCFLFYKILDKISPKILMVIIGKGKTLIK